MFSKHHRLHQTELKKPIYSLKIQKPWASAKVPQRILETRWNPKAPRGCRWSWVHSVNSNSAPLRKSRMAERKNGHTTSLKQKAFLYFMSKHMVSVRPPTIARNPQLMNWGRRGGKIPIQPLGAHGNEAIGLYSSFKTNICCKPHQHKSQAHVKSQ